MVSVIIPCFRQARFLNDSIGSVLAQTYKDIEIIVVDDGNDDPRELTILGEMENAYPNIRFLHKKNGGVSSARNFGIREAKGTYILPLDADDKISSNFIVAAVAALDSDNRLGIVGGRAEMFGAKTGELPLAEYSFPYILAANTLTVTQMYRREDWRSVGGYNENMVYGYEDWDFWLSIVSLGRTVRRIPSITYYYRQVANSRSEMLESALTHRKATLRQLVENHKDLYDRYPRHRSCVLNGHYSVCGKITRAIARTIEMLVGQRLSRVCWKLRHVV